LRFSGLINIADQGQLEAYLLDRAIINTTDGYRIQYCSGGVSGIVVFVMAGDKSLIVKQALGQLKVKEDWFCDPNRMDIEQKSNAVYHRLVPDCTPGVLAYDAENYIYIREAAPESSVMWKIDLLSGLLDFSVAEKVIRSLAVVHNSCAGDREIADEFGDKTVFYELRVSPYIEFVVQKHPRLKEFAAPIVSELMGPGITLVHGDFSPKNVMVDNRKVYILDFEVAHYGHPSFDLAFFANHFVLKSIKNKPWGPSYLNMLDFMLKIYFARISCTDPEALEKSFVKLLSLMMLARIDGKSPVEYITAEADKKLVKDLGFRIIDGRVVSYGRVLKMVMAAIDGNGE
jgi:hypothetical protein